MKTSNKILMGLGVTLLLFPVFLTLLKNVENKKAPKVFNKYTYDYVPEKLLPFKHLKVVGSYHNMQLAFASSDSAFAFVPQDKSAPPLGRPCVRVLLRIPVGNAANLFLTAV